MGRYLQRKYCSRKHKRLFGAGSRDRHITDWNGASSGVNAERGVFGLLVLICLVAGQLILFYRLLYKLYAHICWYIVLQKRLVCHCEATVARNQRGDDSRIKSVQLGHKYCKTSLFTRADFGILIYAISIRVCIYRRRKSKKSRL